MDNIGFSAAAGNPINQNIGDSSSDDFAQDDFVSFTNFGTNSVDISGWELYVDQNGTGSAVFVFPLTTVLAPAEQVTVIADWNTMPSLPVNWFDANFLGSNGLFNDIGSYAILRNPSTGTYLSVHKNTSGTPQTLPTGTMVCDVNINGVGSHLWWGNQLVYWDCDSDTYEYDLSSSFPRKPGSFACGGAVVDIDNDGILEDDVDYDNDGIPNDDERCDPTLLGSMSLDVSSDTWQSSGISITISMVTIMT